MQNQNMRPAMSRILELLTARAKCIWVETYEEADFVSHLRAMLSTHYPIAKLMLWSHTQGLSSVPLSSYGQPEPADTRMAIPRNLFTMIGDYQNHQSDTPKINLWVLRDLHLLIDSHEVKRLIRDIKEYPERGDNYNPLIVVAPTTSIPIELEKLFEVVQYDLPTREEVETLLLAASKAYGCGELNDIEKIINACSGLTYEETSSAVVKSFIRHGTIDIGVLAEEKIRLIEKSGLLSYIVPRYTFDDIGGNKSFKQWAAEVKESFSDEARKFGVQPSKGYLALGIPGSAKTVSAEAFANMLGVPLIVLDMSKVMNKLVGESEKRISHALRIVKACAPCVLLIDELEKSLGGIKSSNASDSGVVARIFGACLQFLNEDTGVFVVMTSNDVSQLPPELVRSGRLDTQWYFGLPSADERREIVNIHFKLAGKPLTADLVEHCVNVTENFTGAEIRELAKITVRKAFLRYKQDGDPDIKNCDIDLAVKEIVPLYKSSREKILALDSYAASRARHASGDDKAHNPIATPSINKNFVKNIVELNRKN